MCIYIHICINMYVYIYAYTHRYEQAACTRIPLYVGVALVSRIDKIIGLFCKRAL